MIEAGLSDVLLPSDLTVLGSRTETQVSRRRGKEGIGLAESGVAIARPKIEFWFLGELGFKRVSFDVSASLEEVGVFEDRQTFIAALPEMSGGAVDAAVVPGIGQLKPLQCGDKSLRIFSVKEQMDVVRHEAVMVTAQGRSFRKEFVKETPVGFIIGRLMEYGLPIVAAGQDMINGLRSERACGSRHFSGS